MTDEMPDAGTGQERGGFILLALALVSATALMWPAFTGSPLLLDEHVSYWIAGSENPGTLWTRSLDYAATPPLSSLMQRTALSCGGKSARVMRVPSAICFLAAILGVYLTGSALRNPILGGMAALFLAWHPEVVDWMRVARPYGLSVALAAWALWLTVRRVQDPQSRRWSVGWVCVNAALVWTHYLNLPLVLLQVVTLCGWLRLRGQDGAARGAWQSLAALLLLLLPLSSACRRIAEWSPFLNYRQAAPPLSEMMGPIWWAGLPLGLLVAAALCASLQRETASAEADSPGNSIAALLFWGVTPLIALAVGAEVLSPTLGEARYRIVYAPAGCLLIAALLENVLRRLRPERPAPAFGILLPAAVVALTAAWWASGQVPWRSQMLSAPAAGDWEALADELEANGTEGEPVFVSSGLIESRLVPGLYADPLFMDYTACRLGRFYVDTAHPRYALPWVWASTPDLTAHYQDQISRNAPNDVVWVAGGTDTDLGRGAVAGASDLLRGMGYRETNRWEKPTAVLLEFTRPDAGASGEQELRARE